MDRRALTSRCTARWPMRHAALTGNYRQISHKNESFWCSVLNGIV